MKARKREAWAVKWRSVNLLDGLWEHFIFHPVGFVALYNTRREAIAARDSEFGYIRNRPDLREEPHGWKLPSIVRVSVLVTELKPKRGRK